MTPVRIGPGGWWRQNLREDLGSHRRQRLQGDQAERRGAPAGLELTQEDGQARRPVNDVQPQGVRGEEPVSTPDGLTHGRRGRIQGPEEGHRLQPVGEGRQGELFAQESGEEPDLLEGDMGGPCSAKGVVERQADLHMVTPSLNKEHRRGPAKLPSRSGQVQPMRNDLRSADSRSGAHQRQRGDAGDRYRRDRAQDQAVGLGLEKEGKQPIRTN